MERFQVGQDRSLCFSIVSFTCRTTDNSVSVEHSQDTSKVWPHSSLLGVQPVVDFPTGLDLEACHCVVMMNCSNIRRESPISHQHDLTVSTGTQGIGCKYLDPNTTSHNPNHIHTPSITGSNPLAPTNITRTGFSHLAWLTEYHQKGSLNLQLLTHTKIQERATVYHWADKDGEA